MLSALVKRWVFIAGLVTAVLVTPNVIAGEELSGAKEYQRSCAACHGVGGEGDGPQAQALSVEPADLTILTKNNGGVFPDRKVLETIDGRWFVFMHRNRTMPVWGSRYSSKLGGDEQAVRDRILELVQYIKSIQE